MKGIRRYFRRTKFLRNFDRNNGKMSSDYEFEYSDDDQSQYSNEEVRP